MMSEHPTTEQGSVRTAVLQQIVDARNLLRADLAISEAIE